MQWWVLWCANAVLLLSLIFWDWIQRGTGRKAYRKRSEKSKWPRDSAQYKVESTIVDETMHPFAYVAWFLISVLVFVIAGTVGVLGHSLLTYLYGRQDSYAWFQVYSAFALVFLFGAIVFRMGMDVGRDKTIRRLASHLPPPRLDDNDEDIGKVGVP